MAVMKRRPIVTAAEIYEAARAKGWDRTGRKLCVKEGPAQPGKGIDLNHDVEFKINDDTITLSAAVTTTRKLRAFLKQVTDEQDLHHFLLEQHAGTPFVRFTIVGANVVGYATYFGPWSDKEPLCWMIRDLARECQRLKSMVEVGAKA